MQKLMICGDRNGVRQYTGARGIGGRDYEQITGRASLEGVKDVTVILVSGWGRVFSFADLDELTVTNRITFKHETG